MIGSLIEIAVGYFILKYVPSLIDARGVLATIIKLIGVLILIAGFVSLAQSLFSF